MPMRAKRPCAGRCGALVETGYCAACQARGKGSAARRTSAERGYNGPWRKYRIGYLRSHPMCVDPRGVHPAGVVVPANTVDHITPHRGNSKLFWDPANHQALCASCHSYKTATEDGGFGH